MPSTLLRGLLPHCGTQRHLLPCRTMSSLFGGRVASPPSDVIEARARLENLGEGSIDVEMDQVTGIASICINNPTKRNAISGRMMVQLERAVDSLELWSDGKAVLLHAAASSCRQCDFCSGGDLTTVRSLSGSPADGRRMSVFMQHTLCRLSALPLVSVSVVTGRALGGGAELCLATDFRVFSPAGSVQLVQARMGLTPGWGGGARLVTLLGRRAALDLLTSCRRVEVAEAIRLGLADAVLDVVQPGSADEALKAARLWLQPRVDYHVDVVRNIKRVVQNASPDFTDTWCRERELFAELWGAEANRKALDSNIKHS